MMPCRWNPAPGLVNRCRRLHPSSAPRGTPPALLRQLRAPARCGGAASPPPPPFLPEPQIVVERGFKTSFFPGAERRDNVFRGCAGPLPQPERGMRRVPPELPLRPPTAAAPAKRPTEGEGESRRGEDMLQILPHQDIT